MTKAAAVQTLWDLITRRVRHYQRRNGDARFNVLVNNVVQSLVPDGDPAADQLAILARAIVLGFSLHDLESPQGFKRYRAAVEFASSTSGTESLTLDAAKAIT